MNALKHAFPDVRASGKIVVAYDMAGTNWKLSVSDDGIGKPEGVLAQGKSGLGTGIVQALSQQLDAKVDTSAGPTRHEGVDHPCHFPDQGRPRRLREDPARRDDAPISRAPAAPPAVVAAAIGSPHGHSARLAEDVASVGRFAHPSDNSLGPEGGFRAFSLGPAKLESRSGSPACTREMQTA